MFLRLGGELFFYDTRCDRALVDKRAIALCRLDF
jgi:hypothetical protein